jgi:YfiH family protein
MVKPSDLPALRSAALERPGIGHMFFTRLGGVSTGIYASLNGGTGSRDDPQAVTSNRDRMAAALGVAPTRFLIPYQVHSAEVRVARAPWNEGERPRCDGLVTDVPGLALGVTGADCGMILFADPERRVIGACHAGWKGAFDGILEATLDAMVRLGAKRAAIVAVLGPTIGRASYEVGPEFVARFYDDDPASPRFFSPSAREGHAHFDLPAYIGERLRRADVGIFEDLARDTYGESEHFFSYRRSVHRGEPDYGRLVSAIVLR